MWESCLTCIQINRSICGCNLRTGAMVIAVLSTIIYGILTSVFFYVLLYAARIPDWLQNILFGSDLIGFLIINAIFFGIKLCVGLDLLYGAIMEKKFHLIPFALIALVSIVMRFINIIVVLCGEHLPIVSMLILIGECYFLLHVTSYYIKLKQITTPPDPEDDNPP